MGLGETDAGAVPVFAGAVLVRRWATPEAVLPPQPAASIARDAIVGKRTR
jgi:hypothetical protein